MGTILELRKLSVWFESISAVNEVDLAVPEGKIMTIIGPNGAGKTTVLNSISGLVKPAGGSVLFRGEDVTGFSPHHLSLKGIGRSFQQNNVFFNLPVWENVRLAAQAHGRDNWKFYRTARSFPDYGKTAETALTKVDLVRQAHRRASFLSQGGLRRLELAILLATSPILLLMDEPLAGVADGDIPALTTIISNLRKEGRTILWVEHKMDQVLALSDEILVMDHGEAIALGSPGVIAADERVRTAYLGRDKDE
ncbi:MAG: ABC transporter ATP-binding protein [Peptococcaceae bacterium]|jgi:branched-chain amino acid transport system ATP-binding protein|nr:ABC transporter ATP-binding protein [Peptococcaceae bacterium]